MKTITTIVSAMTLLALAALPMKAQSTYTGTGDADGTTVDGDGFSSVVVNNTSSTISFTINSTAPMASYIFYAIEIQQVGQGASGYAGFVNPFGPAVGISSGVNAVIDTYGTGATPYVYTGGNFVTAGGIPYAAGGTLTTSATITVPLSSVGLSLGSSFYFDAVSGYTSTQNGGPQAAYGALDNTGYLPESDGLYEPYDGVAHYDSATSAGTTFGTAATEYTVQAVPEPSTWVLMGMGALAMIRRSLGRKA
jgi:hypothetical protein